MKRNTKQREEVWQVLESTPEFEQDARPWPP